MSHLPPNSPKTHAPLPKERRLGGALAILFWCACGVTAIPLAMIFSVLANMGVAGAQAALMDGLTGPTLSAQLLRLGLIPQVVLFAWGAAMVGLTIAKSRHALTVVPWLLVAWVAVSAYCQFAIRSALSPNGADVMDFAALMPGILVQAAAAAAFFGYFAEGGRPKAFYVR